MKRNIKGCQRFILIDLKEHKNPMCRSLHFIGARLLFVIIAVVIFTGTYAYLYFLPIVAYGFAWVGHYFFEKNKPATFKYSFYSFASDFIMFKDLLCGQEKFNPRKF